MLLQKIILKFVKKLKYAKLYFNIMNIIAIVSIIILIIFGINIGKISLLLLGISFYLIIPKRILENYEFEKNNPHIRRTYFSREGLPGYLYLLIGTISILSYIFVLIV